MGAIQYDGTHSINFFNLSESEPLCHNSWTDFHLVPSKRPHVNNPSLNYQYASIPNSNTRKDVSAAYNRGQRNGEWEFYIDYDEWEDWATCYRAMVNYLHGFKMAVRLKDHEYDRMYEGRIVVKNYAPGNDYSKITLEYYFDNGYISDPSAMNFHFNVWWIDWDGMVRSENVPWGGTPSGPGSSGGGSGGTDGYSDPGSIYDNTTLNETFPTSIKIITRPSVLSYYEGSAINYSGIVVSAFKSDGTLWSENSSYPNGAIPYAELRFPTSVASASNSEGTQLLGVFWSRPNDGEYLNDAFVVTVIDATPAFISITTLPTKLSYGDGDQINYSGISVQAYLSDGTVWSFNASYPSGYIPYSELIFPTSIASMPSSGTEQTLEVQWARVGDQVKLTSTFEVSVIDTLPAFISITTLPTNRLYTDGDHIDYSGISVRAYMSDGTVWSYYSTSYPSGYIPYSELNFPTSIASLPSSGITQALDVQWARIKDQVKLSSTFNVTVIQEYEALGVENLIQRTYTNYINSEVTYVSQYAFYNYSTLEYIYLPRCSEIGFSAFYNCSSLIAASFPTCKKIYNGAFSNCSSLKEVYLPECSEIGFSAFYNCSSLTKASFPACKRIYADTFYGCSSLTEVTLQVCSYIDDLAFNRCVRLLRLTLLGSVRCNKYTDRYSILTNTPIAGYTTYTDGEFGSIYVPASLYSEYISAPYWSNFSKRFVSI